MVSFLWYFRRFFESLWADLFLPPPLYCTVYSFPYGGGEPVQMCNGTTDALFFIKQAIDKIDLREGGVVFFSPYGFYQGDVVIDFVADGHWAAQFSFYPEPPLLADLDKRWPHAPGAVLRAVENGISVRIDIPARPTPVRLPCI